MFSPSRIWAPIGLLILGVKESFGNDYQAHHPHSSYLGDYDTICTSNVTVTDTTTVISSTTLPVTHYVDVTVPHYVNVTISRTETCIVSTSITESTTTTLHYTVSVTETDSTTTTETDSTTVTKTDSTTVTETDSTTTTETDSTTTTETDTSTITNIRTVLSTTVDPCPKSCSISAATVNLFFWPTYRPYTYPSTYVDTSLGYTFTWPSVYMLIPTARGINTLGQPAGPSTTSWMLPLDLAEVSTIVGGSITRQLTLSDLGTDCPQTAEPSAIASMVDPRCDPILAAPKQVSSWAYPCNACGRFGLFDPPYAVPTVTGGLVETTPVRTVTAAPAPTSAPPVGVLLVVYYLDGKPVATATMPTTGITGTVTTSVLASATGAVATSSPPPIITPVTSPSTSLSTSATSAVTASATRVTGGLAWLISSIVIAAFLW